MKKPIFKIETEEERVDESQLKLYGKLEESIKSNEWQSLEEEETYILLESNHQDFLV